MLIKEYRIALPMSVDEYRIAQLYMIQRKSREESSGSDSGVEILINEPYTNGPGGDGQYTHKIYHIGSHLPGWFRAILPKSALQVEEEAWNAYPYTKTIYRCPFIEKFSLEIETVYKNDNGEQDNVFDLSKSELRSRLVDYLDIVQDTISSGDYRKEEDPTLFVSEKTGRGPLEENWRTDYGRICANTATRGDKRVMCAYKLCKVEFRYWGMQSKIERFIHDVGLRKTMLRAHRQAWCWQDEYHGLTIEDIRELERQTQEALAEKMAAAMALENGEEEGADAKEHSPKKEMVSLPSQDGSLKDDFIDATVEAEVKCRPGRKNSSMSSFASDRRQSWGSARSKPSGSVSKLSDWRVESIEQLASSSDEDEFFDAQEDMEALMVSHPQMFRSTSMEMLTEEEMEALPPPSPLPPDLQGSPLGRRMEQYQQRLQHLTASGSLDYPALPALPQSSVVTTNCRTTLLFLILHGGSVMDIGGEHTLSKHSDISTFKSTMRSTIEAHYPAIQGHVAFRLIQCPAICTEALTLLASLSPYGLEAQTPSMEPNIVANENFPLGAIALMGAGSPEYYDAVVQVITRANATYNEFLRSEEGAGFNGQVCLIGDSVGSIIGYDALCKNNPYLHSHGNSRYGSNDALHENDQSDSAISDNPPPTVTKRVSLETIKQVSLSNPDLTVTEENAQLQQKDKINSPKKSTNNQPQQRPVTMNGTVGVHETTSSSRSHHSRPPPLRHASCPASRRTSTGSQSELGKFEFEVTDFFTFGSPLALVLAYRKLCLSEDKSLAPPRPPSQYLDPLAALIGYQLQSQNASVNDSLPRPSCHQVYNLFYSSDPSAVRLEPLLHDRFKHVTPCKIPRYQKFPLGDGQSVHVVETIQSNALLLMDPPGSVPSSSHSAEAPPLERRSSNMSVSSQLSGHGEISAAGIASITNRWWGNKRLDFALYCPDALQNFPTNALTYLLHASFWESSDVASFILRQVVRQEYVMATPEGGRDAILFKPTQPREKWQKRRTTIKLRNVGPNHRANDVIVQEDKAQVLCARFMYGPLDMVCLSGEKVDIHVMTQPPNVEWTFFGTEVTDGNGRATFTIPKETQLPQGMYPVKMVVRGDHTAVDFYLTVLPPRTETVVFSIDGSFTASVSIMGKDPKVRPGAVDVVRHWQDLGYLILYISARPDMQQKKVVAWLAQHNFPHGMVAFMDGLSADPLRQKANYLRNLTQEGDIAMAAAYGSSKDVQVYQSMGMKAETIYIVGKVSKKMYKEAVVLCDGYAAHLHDLTGPGGSRQAQGNARLFLRKSCFSLPGQNKASSKKPVRKTLSLPQRGSHRGESPMRMMMAGENTPSIAISDTGNTVIDPSTMIMTAATQRARGGVAPRGKLLPVGKHTEV